LEGLPTVQYSEEDGRTLARNHFEEIAMAETEKKAKAPAKPRKTAAKAASKTKEVARETAVQAQPAAPTHEQIRQLAHKYWAERGHQSGHPELDWFRAERELRGKAS
jgi:hypothetical protein